MSYHEHKELLETVNGLYPKAVMETLVQMQCEQNGLFGTGGSGFVGASQFNSSGMFGRPSPAAPMPLTDIFPPSPFGQALPPELQLIIRALDKVALQESLADELFLEDNALRRDPQAQVEASIQLKHRPKSIPIPVQLSAFDTEPFPSGFDSNISLGFCHGWWASDSTDENGKGSGTDEKSGQSNGKNDDRMRTQTAQSSRSRSANIHGKTNAGKRGSRRVGKSCGGGGGVCAEDDETSNGTTDEADLPSITIVIDGSESDESDDNGKQKRPNTHKKGQIRPPKEEIPRNDARKPGKGSKRRRTYTTVRSIRNHASSSSSRGSRQPTKRNKRAPGRNC